MPIWTAETIDELLDVIIAALETNAVFKDSRTMDWLEKLETVAGVEDAGRFELLVNEKSFFRTDNPERAGLAWLLTVQFALRLLAHEKTTIRLVRTKDSSPVLQAKVGDYDEES